MANPVTFESVDLTANTPHEIAVSWPGVLGATRAQIESASLVLRPSLRDELIQLTCNSAGDSPLEREVHIPPHTRLRSLGLAGLSGVRIVEREGEQVPEDAAILEVSDLGSITTEPQEPVVLVISTPDAKGEMSAQFAIPPVGRRGPHASSYTGASFSSGTVTLGLLDTRALRVGIHAGVAPDQWKPQPIKIESTLSASVGRAASRLTLTDSSGTELWVFPTDFAPPLADAEADLRIPLQTAMQQKLDSGSALDVRFSLKSATDGRIELGVRTPRGALIREWNGVHRIELFGEPVTLEMDGPLDPATPESVIGDLSIQYEGVRLEADLCDAVPPDGGAVGFVVGPSPIARRLSETGVASLARIALIGRAAEESELLIRALDSSGQVIASASLQLEKSARLAAHWIDLEPVEGNITQTIEIQSRSGRFLWASNGKPLVKIAVRDPKPGGRMLWLGDAPWTEVHESDSHEAEATFPAQCFAGDAPRLRSDLFLTLDLSDLRLRYAR